MSLSQHSRSARVIAGGCALLLLLTACGGEATEAVSNAEDAAAQAVQQGGGAIGSGPNAVGAASIGAPPPAGRAVVGPPVADTVEVRYPDLIIRTPGTISSDDLLEVATIDGVDHFASLAEVETTLTTAGSSQPVKVLAVDPTTFRPLTPEVTANVRAVWERLQDGDVLVRHDVAHSLDLQLGGHVELAGATGPVRVRIGAFASNGAPPLADVIVPWTLRESLGATATNLLVLSVDDEASITSVRDELAERVEDADVSVRERPSERQAALAGGPGIQRFEPFSYVDLGDGLIVIDGAWVRTWIVTVDLPYLGRTRCHRLMVPQLLKALEQIGAEGLHDQLDPSQFAGCWVPRHIDWDPSKPLSMHAWGLAVDINSHDNCLACPPQMHPRIVEIFRSWGFEWGGSWSRPDGMHFELDRLIQVS